MVTRKLFKGKIYPDRSFTIGFCPSQTKNKESSQYDHDLQQQEEPDYGAVADWLTGVNTIEGKFQSISESPLFTERSKSSQKKRGSYGKHGITNFGRRFCKNACILLEQRYGIKRLGFATCTLPGMGADTCRAINGNLSDITRRFYQKIRRIFEKRGQQFIYVGCVEMQEKRFRTSGLPVPHIHFVYVAKAGVRSGYTASTEEFYTAWNNSVNEVLVKLGCEKIMGIGRHKGSVKLKRISSTIAVYLAKYLSKGCKAVKAMQDAGFEEFPKQWWTASMQCKKMFRESIIHIDGETASSIFYGLEHYLHEGTITWAKFVDVMYAGTFRVFGVVGTFSPQAYQLLKSA